MPNRSSKAGSELFIVDNSDTDWKVLRYLHDWCQISNAFDIATGYFEIGALLALKDEWQKVDQIRILMGDEVSKKTKLAFVEGLHKIKARLDASLEAEKESNDFLDGVPAIVRAIRSGKIKCRVYRLAKFHAKAYITHARLEVVGASGLVGSSNFTYPGLTENIELNVQITGRPVSVLQEWYEEHWNKAEDVTPDILRVIERHVRDYTPFEVYAKALQEFFKSHEMTVSEWELAGPDKNGSRMYPVLDQYQKDGYGALFKIAKQFNGAFLCDGVGLGKTFIGLMVIERLLHDRKKVVLLVPKAARKPVWEQALKRYLPHLKGNIYNDLTIFNHTDLQRGGEFLETFERVKEKADAFVIDEAHHFRNPGIWGDEGRGTIKGKKDRRPSRYRHLYDLIDGPTGPKQVFMLTATPINNKLIDLQHMIELFSRRHQPEYFKDKLGIHSLPGHFRKMEKDLLQAAPSTQADLFTETNLVEAENVLAGDKLFRAVVVQRSRAYVRASQEKQGGNIAVFPTRQPPIVAEYSVKKTYGKLLDMVEQAFSKVKPLFSLAIYYPLAYYRGSDQTIDKFTENRQKQVVGLIRTGFLKRFESSARAFERSCDRLLLKLLAFATRHSETDSEKSRLERWKIRNKDLIGYVHEHYVDLFGEEDDESDEDLVSEEMLEDVEYLPREDYDVVEILQETFADLDTLADFLIELQKFKPKHDDKLQALTRLLKGDPVLKKHKVLIFTEFSDTARYLREQLVAQKITGIDQIDSATKKDRGEVIRAFSPYYNGSSSPELTEEGVPETRILISTDVLSEGLNLQDATRLINYDLHWNPVRLMQRIGRVDRRLNPDVEKRLVADHPDQVPLRGQVSYWNFLPPEELDELLRLYGKVAHKTVRISRTFGIEGKKLLRPEDDFEALKDFNHAYEGEPNVPEKMHLEFQELLKQDPGLADRLKAFPGRVFSGKKHPQPLARGVFFCYALPGPADLAASGNEIAWTEEAGQTGWYLVDLVADKILEDPAAIIEAIRCVPETPRVCELPAPTLGEIRGKVEKHIKNTWLKRLQAPLGVRPALKAWMEMT